MSAIIKKLKAGEVFVFGSNAEGQHAGGAARTAVEKFGAVMGQGEGAQGHCYAIPTMEGLPALGAAVGRFLRYAETHPDARFLVTAIGTGIAGHSAADVGPTFAGAPANVILPPEFEGYRDPVLHTFKGFDTNLACRGFQFEVGKVFEHTGEVSACASGFHACEYPLDVLVYYLPGTSRFAVVEQSGKLARHSEDSKVASQRIKITAEIGLPGLIKAAIEYTFKRAGTIDPASPASATGDQGAASATGFQGAASATGDQGAASATGDRGAASATGDRGAASATGFQGAASATGDRGAASATGFQGAASATGFQGAASATGFRGAASATGDQGAASATGDRGAASATGFQGAASATGFRGAASATGENSVALACGYEGKAMGAVGAAIFLCFRDDDYSIVHARGAVVGKDGIKADTWYSLNAVGEFVEVRA